MIEVIYRIDTGDRITFINSGWMHFAITNGLNPEQSKSVIGNRMWAYISDLTVRHFYKILMDKVRKTGKCIAVPFRCDSPDMLRLMEMKITKLGDGALEFQNILIRQRRRKKPAFAQTTPKQKMPLMCLGCDKVKVTNWIEPDLAVRQMKIFEKTIAPLVSHDVCPQCLNEGFRTVIE